MRQFLNSTFLLLLLSTCLVYSQSYKREIDGIPVTVEGIRLLQPFTGGIDAPQHRFVDIDSDGDLDLFVRDVDGFTDFYRNEGTPQSPLFIYRTGDVTLPAFQTYFLFVDLNGDGLVDLLTDDSSTGLRFYRNGGSSSVPDFLLHSSTVLDTDGNPVFSGFSSIPGVVDFDGDGLVDFLSTNSADGSINYYRNAGTKTDPRFALVSQSFQGITILGDTCLSKAAALRKVNHGAAAFSFGDLDGTRTPDLFVGDFFARGLFFLANVGTPTDPRLECVMSQFPPGGSLYTHGFNQATFSDLDGDGDLDLVVGVLNNMRRNGFWFYRNIGDRFQPDYQLISKDFLPSLDVGSNAVPVLHDVNEDGLTDLVVGSLEGRLFYWRNEGSLTSPEFVLRDSSFGGITGGFSYAPAFVDIDGDGRSDLFLGQFNGRIKFYRNIGSAGSPQYESVSSPVDAINLLRNAAPSFVDIDADGDLDLFVGRGNGQISYYRNDGSSTSFNPVFITNSFAGINVGENAKPVFVFDRERSVYDLIVGGADGNLRYFRNAGDSTNPQFVVMEDHFNGVGPMGDAAPTLGDVDGDGDVDLFVGTLKGGLHFYRNRGGSTSVRDLVSIPEVFELYQAYPNPFNPSVILQFWLVSGGDVKLEIIDPLGRSIVTLIEGFYFAGSYSVTWNAIDNPAGVYYYRLSTEQASSTRSMILLR